MAKNTTKRISIGKLEASITDDNIVTEILRGTEDVTIQIKKTLSLIEMTEFVQTVVESCIDSENGEYIPEAYDFAIRSAVLTKYANFTLPTNMEKQYWLVYNSSAYNQVMEHINCRQFTDIISCIDKKIKFLLDVISSAAVSKINEVINKFNEIAEESSQMFSGIDAESISELTRNIGAIKDLDEEKVAKAILKVRDAEIAETDNVGAAEENFDENESDDITSNIVVIDKGKA